MEASTSSQGQATTPGSARWQEALNVACQDRKLRPPSWQMYSDRRGGRTAWTCTVTVGGEAIQARNWYDGAYVNNAKEDAAELALRRLGAAPAQPAQAVAGQQQPSSTGRNAPSSQGSW